MPRPSSGASRNPAFAHLVRGCCPPGGDCSVRNRQLNLGHVDRGNRPLNRALACGPVRKVAGEVVQRAGWNVDGFGKLGEAFRNSERDTPAQLVTQCSRLPDSTVIHSICSRSMSHCTARSRVITTGSRRGIGDDGRSGCEAYCGCQESTRCLPRVAGRADGRATSAKRI